MASDPSLKVAVVTGAGRGIGLARTQRFHAESYHVIIIDRDKTEFEACKTKLRAQPAYSFFLCDVSIPSQVQDTFQKIMDKFPSVHALVNNAGVAIFKPAELDNFSKQRWQNWFTAPTSERLIKTLYRWVVMVLLKKLPMPFTFYVVQLAPISTDKSSPLTEALMLPE